MAHRVQPQTTQGHGGYDYGSQSISFDGEGARRVRTGGFGPDATQIQSQGQSSFRRMYDQIRKADERQQEDDDKPKVMESNPVDEFMSNLYKIGENISQPGAVRDLQESDNPVGNIAGFAIGLPFGTIGAIPQGVAQGYEAISGRGVTDEDREDGTVTSLDANQRAASAVNAGINLVGTAFGGSGSMLKGGYRAARTGIAKLGGEAAEQGARKAAVNALKDTAEKFLSPANIKRMAGESAEEAGEEFIQSFADDARYGTSDEGSLGRALESAAWGAAGGAMMSAGGYGLNKVAVKLGGVNADSTDTDPAQDTGTASSDRYRQEYQSSDKATRMTPSASAVAEKRTVGNSTRVAGANSLTLMQSDDPYLGVNEGKIGTEDVRNIWMANDNGKSQGMLANSLGMTMDDANAMFSADDWEDRLIQRVNDINSSGDRFRLYWSRNPATKGHQPVETNIISIDKGSHLMLHPSVLPLVGADVDGDQMTVNYATDGLGDARYATSLLIDPETGANTLDAEAWMRTGLSLSATERGIRRALSDALMVHDAPYGQRPQTGERDTRQRVSLDTLMGGAVREYSKRIHDALRANDFAKVGQVITDLGENVRMRGGDNDAVLNDVVKNLANNPETNLVNSVSKIITDSSYSWDGEPLDIEPVVRGEVPGINGQGATPRNYTPARMLADYQMITYALTDRGNPIFRQFGVMGYKGKAVPSYTDMIDRFDRLFGGFAQPDKYTQMIVSCLKETTQGSRVENSIDAALRSWVISETYKQSGVRTDRIRDPESANRFFRSFLENRNRAAEMSRECIRKLTPTGYDTDMLSKSWSDMEVIDDAWRDSKAVGEFVRIFGSAPVNMIFDTTNMQSRFEGMSINELAEAVSSDVIHTGREFISMGETANEIINSLRDTSIALKNSIAENIKQEVVDLSNMFSTFNSKLVSGDLDQNDIITMTYMLDSVDWLIGEEQAFDLNLTDPTLLMSSRWGREIVSGDSDRALNAIVSAALTGQFRRPLQMYAQAENEAQANHALDELSSLRRISPVHNEIVSQILSNDGKSDLLDLLTDLDQSWASKEAEFKEVYSEHDGNLLIMCLQNKTSNFELSDINMRRQNATQSYKTGRKALMEESRAEVDQLVSMTDVSDDMYVAALEELCMSDIIDMDNTTLAAMIYDSAFFSNKSLEKATLEEAAQMYGQAVTTLVDGSILNLTEKILDVPLGHVSLNTFVSNPKMILGVLSGRIDHLYVYDPTGRKRAKKITRTSIFQECNSDFHEGDQPKRNQWNNVLRKFPQLVRMMSPKAVQSTIVGGSISTKLSQSQPTVSYIRNFSEMASARGDDIQQRRWYAEARRRIRTELRRIPGYPARIVESIPNLHENMDPRYIYNQVNKLMDDFTEVALNRLLTIEGGKTIQEINAMQTGNLLNSAFTDITRLISSAIIHTDLTRQTANAYKTVETEVRSAFSDSMYKQMALRYISDVIGDDADNASVFGAYSNIDDVDEDVSVRNVLDEISKNSTGAMDIVKILIEFSDSSGVDYTFPVSRECVNSVNEYIDLNDDLTDKQKSDIKNDLKSFSSVLTAEFERSNSLDGILFTDADFNNMLSGMTTDDAIAHAKEKARRLWNETGQFTEYDTAYDSRIEKAITGIDENGNAISDIAGFRRSLKIDLDSKVMNDRINKLNLISGANANANMLRAYIEADEFDHKIDAQMRVAMSEWPGFVEGTTKPTVDVGRTTYPAAHILDPATQAMVSKLNSADVPASMVATNTAFNGMSYQTKAAYGALPRNKVCSIAPRDMTAEQIRDIVLNAGDRLDPSDVHIARPMNSNVFPDDFVYDPEKRGKTWRLSSLTDREIQAIMNGTTNATFKVFMHDDCENGLCIAHQKKSVGALSDGYLSIPNIINKINQHSQEAMNLKFKKRANMLVVLGDGWEIEFDLSETRLDAMPDGTISSTDSVAAMLSLKSTRDKITDMLANVFNQDNMAELGFGRDQASQLAQVMVQGVEFRFSNGKEDFIRIAPKKILDMDLNSWLAQVTAETGAVPVSFEPNIRTLDELSMFGMNYVLDHMSDDMSSSQIEELMYQGMTDLSSVPTEELSLDEVIGSILPPGVMHPNTVPVSTNPSKAMSLRDAMNAQQLNSVNTVRAGTSLEPVSDRRRSLVNGMNVWFDNRGKKAYATFRPYIAFGAVDYYENHKGDVNDTAARVANELRVLDESNKRIDPNEYMENGMAVAFDMASANRALMWAKEHGQPFAVLASVVNENGSNPWSRYYATSNILHTGGGQMEVWVIDPSSLVSYTDGGNGMPKSKRQPGMIQSYIAMNSVPGLSMADAGSFANKDTIGTIITENAGIDINPVQQITGGFVKGTSQLADCADIKRLVDELREGIRNSVNLRKLDADGWSGPMIDQAINDYIDWFDNSEDGEWHPDTARPGDIIGFIVTDDSSGSTVYSPIIIPRTATRTDLTNVNINKIGDAVAVTYTDKTNFADTLRGDGEPRLYAHKIALNGVAYKSMATVIDPGQFKLYAGSEMPSVAALFGGKKKNVDLVIDHLALAGRKTDMEGMMMLDNLWYFSKSFTTKNPFVKMTKDGMEFSDFLQRMMREQPARYTPELMRSLFTGTGEMNIWKSEVADKGLQLTDSDKVNELIWNIVDRCFDHGIYPMDIFASAYLNPTMVNSMLQNSSTNMKLANTAVDNDYRMVLGYLNRNDLLTLFNWMDSDLVPSSPETDGDTRTVFDQFGRMYIDFGLDENDVSIVAPIDVTVGPVYNLGKGSYDGTPSTSAKLSAQARVTRAFENGLRNQDPEFFIKYFAMRTGRSDILNDIRNRQLFPKEETAPKDLGFEGSIDKFYELKLASVDAASQRNYERKLYDTYKSFSRWVPLEDKINDRVYDSAMSLNGNSEIQGAMSDLNAALRGDGDTSNPKVRNITLDEVMMLYVSGSSYTYNDGVGSQQGSLHGFRKFIEEMTRNINGGKLPILVRKNANQTRYATPLIPRDLAASLYEISPRLQKSFDTFDDFKNAMLLENRSAIDQFNNIRDEAKRNEIFRLNDWLMLDWGLKPSTGHIYAHTNRRDMINTNNRFIMSTNQSILTREQIDAEKAMAQRESEYYAKLAQWYDSQGSKKSNVDVAHNGEVVTFGRTDTDIVSKTLRNASELSRFMAMLDPFIPAANIIDRVVHQGTTNAMMQWCMNNGVGPYKSSFVPDQNIVKQGADSLEAEKVFDVIRYASYDGDEGRVLSQINTMDDVNSYLTSRRESLGKSVYRRAVEATFELAGGGKFMQKYQIRNWFNQFSRIISSNEFREELGGQTPSYLVKPDGGDQTLLEIQWAESPSTVLMDVFGNRDNPYHTAALQALNFSRAGEAAQQNALYALYAAAAKRSPAFEFFTTTCVSRFFLYSTNMTGRVLNIIAPVSSINYVVNDFLSKTKLNDKVNFKSMQMYTNLREAISVDLMHMAPAMVALLLSQIPGIFEPPEDEDKMGNPDEWTICGVRIADDWLISDTMGISLPLALFFTSCTNGNPRFDLLSNGILQACYNNPMLKATSVIGGLFDPEETFITEIGEDFASDQETYADAPGGSPDFVQWFMGKAWSSSLSFASQFFTPTIVRSLGNSYEIDQYERAYRYVTATDSRGEPIIDPDTGMPTYQETSYFDAQTRRVTRTNPILGFMMDIFTGSWMNGTTGYTRYEMPRTVYYDDAQLEYMNLFSVNDENGEPLPADQQQEKIYMVLSVLMQNDDMDELAATGFYLDYDTKMMVGDTIHDIIQSMRDNYSNLNASGFFDYYYGGLSYEEGRARAEQLKSEYYDELAFWQDLYYNKLWSEPLKKQLTVYNRYNTTYTQDDDGNWYATGYYNSYNPLLRNAMGNMEDPAATAGWENDWRSISAVTGQPMDQRALIPVEAGYLDTPDLDDLGSDSNGGYSNSYPGYSYANSINGDGYSYGGGGWGWRSYGYGRGGGGGGRGGGYSPNLYSRLPSVNMPYAGNMYAERLYDPNYDYLRPNFETKGSREAYKRSDI